MSDKGLESLEKAFGFPRWLLAQYLIVDKMHKSMISKKLEEGKTDKDGRVKLWGYSRDRYLALQQLALEYGFTKLYEMMWKDKEWFHNMERLAYDVAKMYGLDPEAEWNELHRFSWSDE